MRTTAKKIGLSLFDVLSKAAWPLHLGCILAVIGVMASLLANIFGIPWDPSKPNPKDIPLHQLYEIWQLCTVLIVTLLVSSLLNLLRSVYMQSQKESISAGTLSVSDWLFNSIFLVACFLFPLGTIYIGLYSIKILNRAMQSYLQIKPNVTLGFSGSGFIWVCIVYTFRFLSHNPIFIGFIIIPILLVFMTWRTYKIVNRP